MYVEERIGFKKDEEEIVVARSPHYLGLLRTCIVIQKEGKIIQETTIDSPGLFGYNLVAAQYSVAV